MYKKKNNQQGEIHSQIYIAVNIKWQGGENVLYWKENLTV